MGFLGGALEAFNGDPTFNTLDNVKSQPFQKAINSGLSDYNSLSTSGTGNYNNWLSQYNAGNPAAARNTAQETGAIGGYYDGTVAGQLASLAANRQNAVLSAARLAQAQAIHSNNLSLLGQGGAGMNSYNNGLLARNMAGISSQAALDNAQQQQQNYQQVLGGQIGMAGQRTNLANALAMRAMQPYQMRSGMMGTNQGLLNNLLQMNNANNIYGVQQHKNALDQWSAFGNAADSGLMNVASVFGSLMGGGGMGGGGGSIPKGPSPSGGGGDQISGGGGNGLTMGSSINGMPSYYSVSPFEGGGAFGAPIAGMDGWGSGGSSTPMPQFNNTGSGSFMGTPIGGGAASGFGAGGDAFSLGGGYGL